MRLSIRARIKCVSPEERTTASAQLCARLASEKIFEDAKTILFFAPLPDEPDIWPLLFEALGKGKTVALPRFDSATQSYSACHVQHPETEVKSGQFGIREPVATCPQIELKRLDLVLVPGVAFDLCGRRLGRGRGFYDRLLALVGGTFVGVVFDEQIVAEVPVEPHDIRLNCILTPSRWKVSDATTRGL